MVVLRVVYGAGALERPPIVDAVMEALYASEINVSVSVGSLWDCGWVWTLQLGDPMNGFKAEKKFTNPAFQAEGTRWLIEAALEHFPNSQFAKQVAPKISRPQDQATRRA